MTVHPEHAIVVKRLAGLASLLGRSGCHIQTQQPIVIPPYSEPEPDAAIVFGSAENFVHRHPRADDIACVIEVSAASLRRDRTEKLELYAKAGIGRYLIINLLESVIEVYTEPKKSRYGKRVVLTPKQKVELPTAKKPLVVPVKRLLP
jgi:Uma2 family endonuclease